MSLKPRLNYGSNNQTPAQQIRAQITTLPHSLLAFSLLAIQCCVILTKLTISFTIFFRAWLFFGSHLAVLAHRVELLCRLKLINELPIEIGSFGESI